MPLARLIEEAKKPSPWRVGNEVLYDLCRSRPDHKSEADVIAKVWLIGRSYAAAIERRRNKTDTNDNFYVSCVAPMMISSKIDSWISSAKRAGLSQQDRWANLLQAHHNTTQLFWEITGLEKRSLASKYLHFHAPDIFYIYDTRAVESLRLLGSIVGRATNQTAVATDNEYRKFAEKCRSLQEHVKTQYRTRLSPRELDNLLLLVHAERPNTSFKPKR